MKLAILQKRVDPLPPIESTDEILDEINRELERVKRLAAMLAQRAKEGTDDVVGE